MHELSIAMSIIDGASEEAKRHPGASVKAVHLRLGRLSGVYRDALLFSYRIAAEGTPVEGSELLIEEVGGRDMTITGIEIVEGEYAAASC